MSSRRLPSLFISHGSPMHALHAGAAGEAWAALAQRIGKPRAILMASAHWETNIPMVTGTAQPETIHDFGGFPAELYRIQYAAPGAPALAEEVQGLLRKADICTGIEANRGLDHGAWSPLLHMYPDADVPVLQLAMQADRGARHHLAMGRALEPLRDEGVLIIGSGHMTHNLRDFFTQRGQGGGATASYAREFRDWVDQRIQENRADELVDWNTQAPSALRAHPTPEHFLPLFVALGAAGERWQTETVFAGFEGGSLAMDAYAFA
ncbi:class III extradiol ring-cleavage dioxygenase [Uliginosibacterium sp. H3]|uniref:Class III extradiol ring-cleavage dioxygenase n=1 Tax=Uliginosibacterium silvisoli TaxID=3114758 RepID=A0ABU6K4J2_9RHOO|nr:class III extradiol ring-cleavage dioxygenase [Uliginosibacterium sp. H3]